MKLKFLFFLFLPIYLFAQAPRIVVLESDSILVQSKWYALLKDDIQVFTNLVKDSIIEVENEKYRLRKEELWEEYKQYYCAGYKDEKEMEQELKDRSENIKALYITAEKHILVYENNLLGLWKEELLVVVDSFAVDWKYDFVLPKQALIYSSPDYVKEQALFEEAILKSLNQGIDEKDWETKTQVVQKECLENIRKAIRIHPVDVQKALSKLDVFRMIALWMHGAKLT
jgi:hypothetical protein